MCVVSVPPYHVDVSIMTDRYADIRPYHDDEVDEVLQRLLHSRRLSQAFVAHRLRRAPRWLQGLLAAWFMSRVRKQCGVIHDVAGFQAWLERHVDHLLKRTTTNIEVRGIEQLDARRSYLWLSNHRDIAMDPTLINFALHSRGWPTSRIAIGDNLLADPDIADIMRLNKSFVVKRSVSGRREKLHELTRLSEYIRESLQQGHSIWIAQREGRAKDNRDTTDTAVLKMLALAGRAEKLDFQHTLAEMNPVPVCIQYEWDPCDVLKAQELVARASDQPYVKHAHEDIQSIVQGMTGQKGKVIVSFGQPLRAEQLVDATSMASAMDEQMVLMTEHNAVQHAALYLLTAYFGWPEHPSARPDAATALWQRIADQSPAVQERLLTTYAAPFLSPHLERD